MCPRTGTNRNCKVKIVVSIVVFCLFFMPFSYNGDYYRSTYTISYTHPPLSHPQNRGYNIYPSSLTHTFASGVLLFRSLFKKHSNFHVVNNFFPHKNMVCGKRASKMIAPPKEMLLSFSIGTFLTNSDVTIRKQ